MPVLKARVGGAWVDVGGGVDEVSVGPTAPTDSAVELWYDTSVPTPSVAPITTAIFVPTLLGLTLGPGGVNTARYVLQGGPNVGDIGVLTVGGVLRVGTSGFTVGGYPRASVPSGFNILRDQMSSGGAIIGGVRFLDAGTIGYPGVVLIEDQTYVHFYAIGTAAAHGVEAPVTPTVPFVWGVGDSIDYSYTVIVVRV